MVPRRDPPFSVVAMDLLRGEVLWVMKRASLSYLSAVPSRGQRGRFRAGLRVPFG
jgi:hypothetical protein